MLEQWATVRRGAVAHASVLAFLLRYGNPKPNEPLSEAYERVNESQGWKSYRAIMPPYLTIIEYEEKFSPNGRGSVIEIGEVLRHLFVPNLPGSNEKAKLSAIFESAPPWLIWFTFADYTAAVLDLKCQTSQA